MLLSLIIKELSEAPEGLSYYDVFKLIRIKYGIEIEQSSIRYHLEKLRKQNLLDKKNHKYFLPSPVIGYNGVLLFTEPPAIVNCPYYSRCKRKLCTISSNECLLYKNSSKEFRSYLENVSGKKEGKKREG